MFTGRVCVVVSVGAFRRQSARRWYEHSGGGSWSVEAAGIPFQH